MADDTTTPPPKRRRRKAAPLLLPFDDTLPGEESGMVSAAHAPAAERETDIPGPPATALVPPVSENGGAPASLADDTQEAMPARPAASRRRKRAAPAAVPPQPAEPAMAEGTEGLEKAEATVAAHGSAEPAMPETPDDLDTPPSASPPSESPPAELPAAVRAAAAHVSHVPIETIADVEQDHASATGATWLTDGAAATPVTDAADGRETDGTERPAADPVARAPDEAIAVVARPEVEPEEGDGFATAVQSPPPGPDSLPVSPVPPELSNAGHPEGRGGPAEGQKGDPPPAAPSAPDSPTAEALPPLVTARSTDAAQETGSIQSRTASAPLPARQPSSAPAQKPVQRPRKGVRVGGVAIGAGQAGALALGALAIGALAIGALAIGRLAVGRARVRRLEVDELVIGTIADKEKTRYR